jgi:DNA-dependent RNA polymerase auxiliary subunit epsilon
MIFYGVTEERSPRINKTETFQIHLKCKTASKCHLKAFEAV